jgi:hypothetical protein
MTPCERDARRPVRGWLGFRAVAVYSGKDVLCGLVHGSFACALACAC